MEVLVGDQIRSDHVIISFISNISEREFIFPEVFFPPEDYFGGFGNTGGHIKHIFMFEMKHVKPTVVSVCQKFMIRGRETQLLCGFSDQRCALIIYNLQSYWL